jgi:hypothetical protein
MIIVPVNGLMAGKLDTGKKGIRVLHKITIYRIIPHYNRHICHLRSRGHIFLLIAIK